MSDDGMYVVRVVLNGFAHGPRVRGGKPSEGCAGQNLHHARAHYVSKAQIREVGDAQCKEVDSVARTKCSDKPHKQADNLTSVR